MSQWMYFGCNDGLGHYLFNPGMYKSYERKFQRLNNCDGLLPPQESSEPYIATVSRLEGWGLSALAFWDYSVDNRSGSNSVIFAPSLTITPSDLLAEAQKRFPQVFNRLPQAVRLVSEGA